MYSMIPQMLPLLHFFLPPHSAEYRMCRKRISWARFFWLAQRKEKSASRKRRTKKKKKTFKKNTTLELSMNAKNSIGINRQSNVLSWRDFFHSPRIKSPVCINSYSIALILVFLFSFFYSACSSLAIPLRNLILHFILFYATAYMFIQSLTVKATF